MKLQFANDSVIAADTIENVHNILNDELRKINMDLKQKL